MLCRKSTFNSCILWYRYVLKISIAIALSLFRLNLKGLGSSNEQKNIRFLMDV